MIVCNIFFVIVMYLTLGKIFFFPNSNLKVGDDEILRVIPL